MVPWNGHGAALHAGGRSLCEYSYWALALPCSVKGSAWAVIILTTLFDGYVSGFLGGFGRVDVDVFVFLLWSLMLLCFRPWLKRFRYGPLEWTWRSLTRWGPQPMRI